MTKPRICMVSHHGCIRVFKESMALIHNSYKVDTVSNQLPFGHNAFETASFFFDEDQLRRTIAEHPADIFHVHNEPDWMVRTVREATKKPIVYDIHDLESMRWNQKPDKDEKDAFEMANAYVHVSFPCRDAANKYHQNGKPNIVLHPYVNAEFVPETVGDTARNAMVYEGGISPDKTGKRFDGKEMENIRYYLPIVEAFIKQGFSFTIFAADGVPLGHTYHNLTAAVYQGVMYPTLLAGLRPYGIGLVGSWYKAKLMDAAMPNKLFEYISQGVVPVMYNANEAAQFCKAFGGIGIELKGLKDLREQIDSQFDKARKRLLEVRETFTMEANIEPLMGMYREIA